MFENFLFLCSGLPTFVPFFPSFTLNFCFSVRYAFSSSFLNLGEKFSTEFIRKTIAQLAYLWLHFEISLNKCRKRVGPGPFTCCFAFAIVLYSHHLSRASVCRKIHNNRVNFLLNHFFFVENTVQLIFLRRKNWHNSHSF